MTHTQWIKTQERQMSEKEKREIKKSVALEMLLSVIVSCILITLNWWRKKDYNLKIMTFGTMPSNHSDNSQEIFSVDRNVGT